MDYHVAVNSLLHICLYEFNIRFCILFVHNYIAFNMCPNYSTQVHILRYIIIVQIHKTGVKQICLILLHRRWPPVT